MGVFDALKEPILKLGLADVVYKTCRFLLVQLRFSWQPQTPARFANKRHLLIPWCSKWILSIIPFFSRCKMIKRECFIRTSFCRFVYSLRGFISLNAFCFPQQFLLKVDLFYQWFIYYNYLDSIAPWWHRL